MTQVIRRWHLNFQARAEVPPYAGDVRCLLSLDEEIEETALLGLARYAGSRARNAADAMASVRLSELMMDRYGMAFGSAPACDDLSLQVRLLERIASWASLWDYGCALQRRDSALGLAQLIAELWRLAREGAMPSHRLMRQLVKLRLQQGLPNDAKRAPAVEALRRLFARHGQALEVDVASPSAARLAPRPCMTVPIWPHRPCEAPTPAEGTMRVQVSFLRMRQSILRDFRSNRASGLADLRTWAWIERELNSWQGAQAPASVNDNRTSA